MTATMAETLHPETISSDEDVADFVDLEEPGPSTVIKSNRGRSRPLPPQRPTGPKDPENPLEKQKSEDLPRSHPGRDTSPKSVLVAVFYRVS